MFVLCASVQQLMNDELLLLITELLLLHHHYFSDVKQYNMMKRNAKMLAFKWLLLLTNTILCIEVDETTAFIVKFQNNNKETRFRLHDSSLSESQIATSKVAVERVNVCMGELCKCQEGENAETLLADLNARNLNFVVDDAPCLGACGMGAMVSIEYEDGDYALVTGLQETLEAIGITESILVEKVDLDYQKNDPETSSFNDVNKLLKVPIESEKVSSDKYSPVNQSEFSGNINVVDGKYNRDIQDRIGSDNYEKPLISTPSVEENHDAIKRMRSAAIEVKPNPWLNMAMYIGQKMKENIVKDK